MTVKEFRYTEGAGRARIKASISGRGGDADGVTIDWGWIDGRRRKLTLRRELELRAEMYFLKKWALLVNAHLKLRAVLKRLMDARSNLDRLQRCLTNPQSSSSSSSFLLFLLLH